MATFSPHFNLYKTIDCISLVNQIVFWLILVLSVAPITLKELCERFSATDLINILNIVGILLFFLLEVINEHILIPQAENKRKDDFIDNSFGSTFSPNNSVDYYDNDEIKQGLFKAAVNLFQNCFFTYNFIKTLSVRKIVIPSIVFLITIVFAYFGFKEVPLALSILQALFSANILGLLIKHLILLNRLSTIHDSWITLFQNKDLKTNPGNYHSSIYRYWLQYETLLSKIQPGIPESVYEKLNPPLTEDWKKLKTRYNIN